MKVQTARGFDDDTCANVDGTIEDDAVRCITGGSDDDTRKEVSCPPPLGFSDDEFEGDPEPVSDLVNDKDERKLRGGQCEPPSDQQNVNVKVYPSEAESRKGQTKVPPSDQQNANLKVDPSDSGQGPVSSLRSSSS